MFESKVDGTQRVLCFPPDHEFSGVAYDATRASWCFSVRRRHHKHSVCSYYIRQIDADTLQPRSSSVFFGDAELHQLVINREQDMLYVGIKSHSQNSVGSIKLERFDRDDPGDQVAVIPTVVPTGNDLYTCSGDCIVSNRTRFTICFDRIQNAVWYSDNLISYAMVVDVGDFKTAKYVYKVSRSVIWHEPTSDGNYYRLSGSNVDLVDDSKNVIKTYCKPFDSTFCVPWQSMCIDNWGRPIAVNADDRFIFVWIDETRTVAFPVDKAPWFVGFDARRGEIAYASCNSKLHLVEANTWLRHTFWWTLSTRMLAPRQMVKSIVSIATARQFSASSALVLFPNELLFKVLEYL